MRTFINTIHYPDLSTQYVESTRATACDRALLLKRGGDEEGVRQGVFVLSDLNADLRDADTDLIEEPQQSLVIYHVCGEEKSF